MNSTSSCASASVEGPRRHMCSIFKGESDQFAAVVPHMLEGLRKNDRCLYISDRLEKADLFERLMDAAPLNEEILEARVSFYTSDEVYLRDGRFDKERMLEFLSDERDQALKDGCSGLTATGEMSWASRDVPGVSDIIEYEAMINFMYPRSSADLLCQYPEKDLDTATLVKAVMAHPKVIVRGTVCGNPYYLPPETLISYASGVVTPDVLEHMAKDLFSRSVLSEIGALEARELKRARLCLTMLDEMVLNDFRDRLSAVSFFNELALGTCRDDDTAAHIRSADSKCEELSERLEALRMFRSCMEAPTEWQSLEGILQSAIDRSVNGSRRVTMDLGSHKIFASSAADKAFAALVSGVAERSRSGALINVKARRSDFGLTVTISADGSGVPEGAKESLFDQAGPCVCGRSLCLARELLESSGISVREVGIPGRSTVFEIHVPVLRYRAV